MQAKAAGAIGLLTNLLGKIGELIQNNATRSTINNSRKEAVFDYKGKCILAVQLQYTSSYADDDTLLCKAAAIITACSGPQAGGKKVPHYRILPLLGPFGFLYAISKTCRTIISWMQHA